MRWLYLGLNVGSLLIPFVYSFHPKLAFYKKWKYLFPALIATAAVFIVWDIIFTQNGVWGFNQQYYLGINWFNLPVEEWLFFICIPYACVFTHYAIQHYFPKFELSLVASKYLSIFLIIGLLTISITNYAKAYTFYNFTFGAILILLGQRWFAKMLSSFYCTFLVILLPFFLVNGILTGSMIDQEVVWYNNMENLGIRLFTIPVEDSIYGFSLIFMNLILVEFFNSQKNNS